MICSTPFTITFTASADILTEKFIKFGYHLLPICFHYGYPSRRCPDAEHMAPSNRFMALLWRGIIPIREVDMRLPQIGHILFFACLSVFILTPSLLIPFYHTKHQHILNHYSYHILHPYDSHCPSICDIC